MSGLGLAVTGLGAAAALVFNDLDEVITAPAVAMRRPCWVKEKDNDDLTSVF